jgi:hypothetical protein
MLVAVSGMSDERKTNFRFITPVDRIPGRKKDSALVYDEVIREFLDSKLKYAEVNLPNKKPLTVNLALKKRLKEKGINKVIVRHISKKVYLERQER